MKYLTGMARQHRASKTDGIYTAYSAHPLMLETAIRYASVNQTLLLVEATSNQVDQFSDYTGVTPADFRGFTCQLADSLNFPQDVLILGGDHLRPESLVDNETLIVVYISSHPYTRQYDLGLLTELRRDCQVMRVIAIAVEADTIIETGPHILLPPSCSFVNMEQAFCFLIYTQVFALVQSIHVGNAPDLPSASGTINHAMQDVAIHPQRAQEAPLMSITSTRCLLQDAQVNAYAIPTFNIHNAETIQAILEVCNEIRSPMLLTGPPRLVQTYYPERDLRPVQCVFGHLRHTASTTSRSSRIVG